MDAFCSPDRFDAAEYFDIADQRQADIDVCARVAEFLDRTDNQARPSRPPRIAFLYLYSPHDGLHEPQDRLSLSIAPESLEIAAGARNQPRNEAAFARYLSSIHFIDRLLAPLLTKDRIVVVTGDHGESFGEDFRYLHGSALSQIQIQVACLIGGPGIPARVDRRPTSHTDVWPTIAAGIQIDPGKLLEHAGRPLCADEYHDHWVSCVGYASDRVLIVKQNRQPGDVELGYQGFFSWENRVFAPGAVIDRLADRIHRTFGDGVGWDDGNRSVDFVHDRTGQAVEFATSGD